MSFNDEILKLQNEIAQKLAKKGKKMKKGIKVAPKLFSTILKAFKGVLNGVRQIKMSGLSFLRFGYFNPKSEFSKSNLKNKGRQKAKDFR